MLTVGDPANVANDAEHCHIAFAHAANGEAQAGGWSPLSMELTSQYA